MLDHLFLDTVGAFRTTIDHSLLERTGGEDRLLYDMLSGDLVWETSVSLPGDSDPPHVSADITLDWQTWSQSAWRSMSLGEAVEDPPEIGVEVVFRAQRLAQRPALGTVLAVLPEHGPELGGEPLTRSAPIIEETFEDAVVGEIAVEVAYEGSFHLPEQVPPGDEEDARDETSLFPGWASARLTADEAARSRTRASRRVSAAAETTLAALGPWVASTLVQLSDLKLDYLPPPAER